jgi:hypothetical protein
MRRHCGHCGTALRRTYVSYYEQMTIACVCPRTALRRTYVPYYEQMTIACVCPRTALRRTYVSYYEQMTIASVCPRTALRRTYVPYYEQMTIASDLHYAPRFACLVPIPYRSTRVSPTRFVTPISSRCSNSACAYLRLVPNKSRVRAKVMLPSCWMHARTLSVISS